MGHQQHQQGQQAPKQQWGSSLFNCAPLGTCLLSTFLPCILIGRTMGRMKDPSMRSYEDFNSECMIFSAVQYCTGCGWIYNMMKRGEIRDQYGIEGSDVGDCCVSYWCMCCSMIQSDNEVKLRTSGQPPIDQGYQSQKEGMHMPTPAPLQQQPEQPVQQPQQHQPMQQPAI